MYPFFYLFGWKISAYSIMAILGGLAVGLFAYIRLRGRKKEFQEVFFYLTYAFGFLVIGAMLLFQIVELDNLIKIIPYLFSDFKFFINNFSVGLVFYGGLYGALIGGAVYSKLYGADSRELFMYLVPAIPLFHIFGRIGCFLSGCCHGVENESFGVLHPDGNYYVPVQLIEAFGDLVIFIILCIVKNKDNKYYKPIGIYLVLYGVMRFVLEFFRGDEVRGFLGLLSTSQWISLVTVPLGLYCLIAPTEKNFFNKLYMPAKKKK